MRAEFLLWFGLVATVFWLRFMPLRDTVLSGEGGRNIPPYIGDVLVHHLSQHVDSMLDNLHEGRTAVFYLGIDKVAIMDDGAVIMSKGGGVFTGPLKSSTSLEKDRLVSALQGMPPGFRSRLDASGAAAMVAVKVSELGGRTHAIGIELSREDLMAVKLA